TGGLAFVRSFLSLSLFPCVVPSNVEGEDHIFLRHRDYHMQLPPPLLLLFVASSVIVAVIRKFLCYCCPLLPTFHYR
ncbi:hypothetical protein BHE74_00025436, partial [Ensete ventricosum]